jgi:hypothetical protein
MDDRKIVLVGFVNAAPKLFFLDFFRLPWTRLTPTFLEAALRGSSTWCLSHKTFFTAGWQSKLVFVPHGLQASLIFAGGVKFGTILSGADMCSFLGPML